jgi:hypothetical protein
MPSWWICFMKQAGQNMSSSKPTRQTWINRCGGEGKLPIAEGVEKLEKLRKRQAEIARVDFFNSPEAVTVNDVLRRIQEQLRQGDTVVARVAQKKLTDYRDARWVTRPRPHVDRLACAWLIRRFINPTAEIRYAARLETGEVGFDMREAEFGHQGNCCTFETMLAAFGLNEPGLQGVAEIVHELIFVMAAMPGQKRRALN